MALGNVFIKDVDGNIPYDTGSGNEKVTGLLFDVSLQPTLFTEGYGKTNESKLKLGDVCYITSLKSAVNDFILDCLKYGFLYSTAFPRMWMAVSGEKVLPPFPM